MQNLNRIKKQWADEMPGLDTSTMALIGRLQIMHKHLTTTMSDTFRKFGLTDAGFDVIATLRRAGKPYRLRTNQLLEQMLVTSGSMTSRLTYLEKKGLVTRQPDKNDGRISWVQLTNEGLTLSDSVINAHVSTQKELLKVLSKEEQAEMTQQLSAYLTRRGLE
jgi:DNA-binding MarR family transcriptional regulator